VGVYKLGLYLLTIATLCYGIFSAQRARRAVLTCQDSQETCDEVSIKFNAKKSKWLAIVSKKRRRWLSRRLDRWITADSKWVVLMLIWWNFCTSWAYNL